MNPWNTNTATLTAIESGSATSASFRSPRVSKSLYVAPPRFDIEGWIFITLLTAFTASLAVLVLSK